MSAMYNDLMPQLPLLGKETGWSCAASQFGFGCCTHQYVQFPAPEISLWVPKWAPKSTLQMIFRIFHPQIRSRLKRSHVWQVVPNHRLDLDHLFLSATHPGKTCTICICMWKIGRLCKDLDVWLGVRGTKFPRINGSGDLLKPFFLNISQHYRVFALSILIVGFLVA